MVVPRHWYFSKLPGDSKLYLGLRISVLGETRCLGNGSSPAVVDNVHSSLLVSWSIGRVLKETVYMGLVIWVQNILLKFGAIGVPHPQRWKDGLVTEQKQNQESESHFEMPDSFVAIWVWCPSFQRSSDWDGASVGALFVLTFKPHVNHERLSYCLTYWTYAPTKVIFYPRILKPWLSVYTAHQSFQVYLLVRESHCSWWQRSLGDSKSGIRHTATLPWMWSIGLCPPTRYTL